MLRFFFVFSLACLLLVPSSNFAQNSTSNSSTELKALAWNLYLLPKFIVRSGQMLRADAIGKKLTSEDYDVLILQEVFGKKSSAILHESLKKHYPYSLGPANKKGSPFRANSGAMIYSKYPLELISEFRFEDCKGVDCWGRKGGVFASFEKDGQKYQVLSTHLQAFDGTKRDKIRQLQYLQILKDIVLPYAEAGVPQLLGGDFNTSREDSFYYDSMLKILGAEDGQLQGDTLYTYVSKDNHLIKKGDYYELLDYILLRRNGVEFKSVDRRVRSFRSNWDKEKRKRKRLDLSDHYAIELILKK